MLDVYIVEGIMIGLVGLFFWWIKTKFSKNAKEKKEQAEQTAENAKNIELLQKDVEYLHKLVERN